MKLTYKGSFMPRNVAKYKGNIRAVYFRSLWERQVFRWCDENPDVLEWSSEEHVIPYRCKTDGRIHRYFVDLYVKFKNQQSYLIEIKPKSQTIQPKPQSRKTKKYITEVLTYVKNQSKWEAATEFCLERGYKFQVWTEVDLKNLGIKILT